jgi:long-chain fatty acid transport protein
MRSKMRFSFRLTPRLLSTATFAALCLVASSAAATNVTEFPDNGSEQMGRGGAWVARASDPLAVVFNPAGLAGQRTALTAQANLSIQSTCFTRVKAANDSSQETGFVDAGGTYPKVCTEGHLFPNPQLAFAYRATDRLGLGIAIVGPSGVGDHKWPDFVDFNGTKQPAPNRYLLIEGKSFFLTPTIGAGYEVIDGLRFGAAFQWGILKAKFNNAAPALNGPNPPRSNDINATLIAADYFVPAFNVGALYSPTEFFDVGAWYKWSDSVKARGDAYIQANYFTPQVAAGNKSGITDTDTSMKNCGQGTTTVCGDGGNATLKLPIPMEARLGFRYHMPRAVTDAATKAHRRDPMAQDVFDAEVDFTWANNSSIDKLDVRFPGNAQGDAIIPAYGTPGLIPPDASVPHHYKDVIGVRVGGDYNVLPNQLALRIGGYFETNGQDEKYQNIDFMGGSRLGVAGGGSYRIPIGENSLDLMLGYMHVFVADQKNDNPNSDGVRANAGSACFPSKDAGVPCDNGQPRYRTVWPVNLGTITNVVNVINVGAAYKF